MERLLAVAAFQLFGRGRIWVFANNLMRAYRCRTLYFQCISQRQQFIDLSDDALLFRRRREWKPR